MPRFASLLICLTALLASLALAACGGDDEESSSPEDEVIEVIETSISSNDPDDCTELFTQQFLEQTEFETGEAAVEQCREGAADESDDADSVDVSDVQIDGSNATAAVAFTGGTFDGQTVEVGLIDEGGWKLDEILAIPDLDTERFAEAFAETATTGPDALSEEQAQCVSDVFAQTPAAELEAVIVSGDQDQLNELLTGC